MVIIGMYSGLRIDEIASLQVGQVTEEGFDLHEGKTDSAVRLVPIHRDIKPLVEKLVDDSKDGYLIPKLGRGGPDKKRSWHIQKMFGNRKTRLGFGRDLVFHSLRRTFIAKLKRAACR
jgi:integrase